MKDKTVIYQCDNSRVINPATEFSILEEASFSEEALKFVNLAINFSKRLKTDIVISTSDTIHIELYLQFGTFMGSIKRMFTELAQMADDILIFPIKDSPYFSLKISLYYDNY